MKDTALHCEHCLKPVSSKGCARHPHAALLDVTHAGDAVYLDALAAMRARRTFVRIMMFAWMPLFVGSMWFGSVLVWGIVMLLGLLSTAHFRRHFKPLPTEEVVAALEGCDFEPSEARRLSRQPLSGGRRPESARVNIAG